MSYHLNPLKQDPVIALMIDWHPHDREYVENNCFALDIREDHITIFLRHNEGILRYLAGVVRKTEGATSEITEYGNLNFTFPGEVNIRIVL